jgi:nitrite reductase/ring-hydroxylating ferredoxin subunit
MSATAVQPYSGYRLRDVPRDDWEIARVGPGTPLGEYFRRHWQPVALSSRITDLPVAIRVLGEDLVVFRDRSGRIGVLHRHCSHRGTSLEYGIVSERGIRCCYHGWLFDVDGTILETPGEPPDSRLRHGFVHGAYPALEYKGLVFTYMGPPDSKPDFPIYDVFELPDNRMVPYSTRTPCNWLQVHENGIDPVHAVFLHGRVKEVHFNAAWLEMPTLEFYESDKGMYYVTVRRLGDMAWVRSAEMVMPNFAQTGALWEYPREKLFGRVSLSRWTVPADDTDTWFFGWRHFNDSVDPDHLGREDLCGHDSVDFVGQTGGRSYEESQRNPGDWEAQVSQRPIANHRLEHLGASDIGVAMLRRLYGKAIDGSFRPPAFPSGRTADGGPIPTISHDTVIHAPVPAGTDDREYLRDLGRRVLDVILSGHDVPTADRQAHIERGLRALAGNG